MAWYRLPDGTIYHIKFAPRVKAPAPCAASRDDGTPCAVMSDFLCDWKIGPRMTCDQPLCESHALQVAPDRHLCPAHQVEYQQWRRERVRPV